MPRGVYERSGFCKHANCRGGDISRLFWERVTRKGPLAYDGLGRCWNWLGGLYANGYGQFRGQRAHRVAYQLSIGPIQKGIQILHRCDNPQCVNPAHLFPGTPKDNMADKVAKGRWSGGRPSDTISGELNPRSKLTQSQVEQARSLYSSGFSITQISDIIQSPVRIDSLQAAILGITWSHLPL
jgi:hypothetical protein